MVPPQSYTARVHVRVYVRIYKSSLGGFELNALLLLALRPFASGRFPRRRLSKGSYSFSLVNVGIVGGSSRIASSNTSTSNAMFLIPLLVGVKNNSAKQNKYQRCYVCGIEYLGSANGLHIPDKRCL
jgi:hypothetical protein